MEDTEKRIRKYTMETEMILSCCSV